MWLYFIGFITPYVVQTLLGKEGVFILLTLLTMTLMSTGSGEVMSASSILVYDIYKIYIRPFRYMYIILNIHFNIWKNSSYLHFKNSLAIYCMKSIFFHSLWIHSKMPHIDTTGDGVAFPRLGVLSASDNYIWYKLLGAQHLKLSCWLTKSFISLTHSNKLYQV